MKKWFEETLAKVTTLVDEWFGEVQSLHFFETPEEKEERLGLEKAKTKFYDELGKLAEARREHNLRMEKEVGPHTSVRKLLYHYGEKGIKAPGSLVMILEEEMGHLLTEPSALTYEDDPLGEAWAMPHNAGVSYVITPQQWFNNGYLFRHGESPKKILHRYILLNQKPTWKIAMYLGTEEDKRGVGPKGSEVRWCKWLIDEKVYVGWIHPDGMKSVEHLDG